MSEELKSYEIQLSHGLHGKLVLCVEAADVNSALELFEKYSLPYGFDITSIEEYSND